MKEVSPSRQQSRASQYHENLRSTKKPLFVSVVAVLSSLPLIIANDMIFVFKVSITRTFLFYYTININHSNTFVNPLVYVLRIPEFKQELGLCCVRRQAVVNREGNEGRDYRAVALTLGLIFAALSSPVFVPPQECLRGDERGLIFPNSGW